MVLKEQNIAYQFEYIQCLQSMNNSASVST